MANDLDIIKELEKTVGRKLEPIPLEKIMNCDSQGYALDADGFVIGFNLNKCDITNLLFLTQFIRLTHLNLIMNKISDISPLQRLTALAQLYLDSNPLSDVSPLMELTALTKLSLHTNQLTDVSPLKGLTALTRLDLDFNQLTDVSPLQGLKQLKRLNLQNNKISQLPEAIFHLGLKVKWESSRYWQDGLHLHNNPLETPPEESGQTRQSRSSQLF
jgi:Leucine-rich repeat (LRR) protein